MLFRETTGDTIVAAEHRRIHAEAAEVIARLLFSDIAAPFAKDGLPPELVNGIGELVRGGLHAITLWWMEHPDIPREHIVTLCMDVYWMGLAQLRAGHSWRSSGQT